MSAKEQSVLGAESDDKASVEHIEQPGKLTRSDALAAAAAEEKAMSTVTAMRRFYVSFAWAMYASVGSAISGYDSTVAGSVLSVPSFRRDLGDLIDGQLVVSAPWQSGFNAGCQLGTMFGGLLTGWLADRIGRKNCLLLASIISIGAIFLEFFVVPHKQVMYFFGRSINGFASGIFNTIASTYCAEVSPLPLRGVTLGAVNFWIVIGQFLSSLVIKGTGSRTDAYAYRIPLAVQWIFPVFILLVLPFAPESPWFFVRTNQMEKAKHAVQRLFGNSGVDLDLHLAQIKETIELEEREAAESRWIDLFTGINRRRTWIASMVFICQEAVGVQFVLGYSTYFFELAGFNDSNAFALGCGTLGLAVVGNLIGIAFTNKLGRRSIFFWGMVACTADTLLIGILSLVKTNGALWTMGVFTMLYMLLYQAGIGPLAYTIFAEVSSSRLRSKTIAWGVAVNQVSALIINVINPYMINPDEGNLQGKVGWIFGGLGVMATIWSWFGIPETTGRTADEIDILFEHHVPARQFKTYVIDEADRRQ